MAQEAAKLFYQDVVATQEEGSHSLNGQQQELRHASTCSRWHRVFFLRCPSNRDTN